MSNRWKCLQSERMLAVFDMDGVLVPIKSSWAHVHSHFNVDDSENLTAYLDGAIDYAEFMKRDVASWFAKKKRIHITEIEQIFQSISPVEGADWVVRQLSSHGHQPIVVSAGIDKLAARVANEVGIPICYANSLVTDDKGYLTGSGVLVVPLAKKHHIVARIQQEMAIGKRNTIGVCDSRFDMSLKAVCDCLIAINVQDQDIVSVCDFVVESFGELYEVLMR